MANVTSRGGAPPDLEPERARPPREHPAGLPAVEYDFVPKKLAIPEGDHVHFVDGVGSNPNNAGNAETAPTAEPGAARGQQHGQERAGGRGGQHRRRRGQRAGVDPRRLRPARPHGGQLHVRERRGRARWRTRARAIDCDPYAGADDQDPRNAKANGGPGHFNPPVRMSRQGTYHFVSAQQRLLEPRAKGTISVTPDHHGTAAVAGTTSVRWRSRPGAGLRRPGRRPGGGQGEAAALPGPPLLRARRAREGGLDPADGAGALSPARPRARCAAGSPLLSCMSVLGVCCARSRAWAGAWTRTSRSSPAPLVGFVLLQVASSSTATCDTLGGRRCRTFHGKGGGSMLNFNCALILVPVLRNMLSCAPTPVGDVAPLDDNVRRDPIPFHACACLAPAFVCLVYAHALVSRPLTLAPLVPACLVPRSSFPLAPCSLLLLLAPCRSCAPARANTCDRSARWRTDSLPQACGFCHLMRHCATCDVPLLGFHLAQQSGRHIDRGPGSEQLVPQAVRLPSILQPRTGAGTRTRTRTPHPHPPAHARATLSLWAHDPHPPTLSLTCLRASVVPGAFPVAPYLHLERRPQTVLFTCS